MKALLKLDRRFILFLLLLPIIWDLVLPDYKNNELVQLLWFVLIYLYQLGAGKALFDKISEERKGSYYAFQLVFVYLLFHVVYSDLTDTIDLDNYIPYANAAFSFLGLIAYGWGVHFISNRLIYLERKLNVRVDGLTTFVLIFVLPVGIWWIHPRMQAAINKTQRA